MSALILDIAGNCLSLPGEDASIMMDAIIFVLKKSAVFPFTIMLA
jgi:hypothetical protein